LLLGNQIVNRLQDLGYRVTSMPLSADLVKMLEDAKPMLLILDLNCKKFDALKGLAEIRQHESTAHIPILAFAPEAAKQLQVGAAAQGATLVASETAILEQLPTLLDRILQID